ncbi:MAG: hypothetical protein ABJD11_01595 [Gemmatimonadota bacterium]
MRISTLAALATMLLLPVAANGQRVREGLGVSVSVSHLNFAGGAMTPATGTEIRPANGLTFEIGADWNRRGWMASIGTGFAREPVQASDAISALVDRTLPINRYRLVGALTRWLVSNRRSRFGLAAAPLLDHWTGNGLRARTVLGFEAQVRLAFPVGRVELENRASLGWEGSPFSTTDLGSNASPRTLRTVSLGLALRYRP